MLINILFSLPPGAIEDNLERISSFVQEIFFEKRAWLTEANSASRVPIVHSAFVNLLLIFYCLSATDA